MSLTFIINENVLTVFEATKSVILRTTQTYFGKFFFCIPVLHRMATQKIFVIKYVFIVHRGVR